MPRRLRRPADVSRGAGGSGHSGRSRSQPRGSPGARACSARCKRGPAANMADRPPTRKSSHRIFSIESLMDPEARSWKCVGIPARTNDRRGWLSNANTEQARDERQDDGLFGPIAANPSADGGETRDAAAASGERENRRTQAGPRKSNVASCSVDRPGDNHGNRGFYREGCEERKQRLRNRGGRVVTPGAHSKKGRSTETPEAWLRGVDVPSCRLRGSAETMVDGA